MEWKRGREREREETGEMMKRRRVFIWRRLGEEMKSQ